jgi:hypothetical protein
MTDYTYDPSPDDIADAQSAVAVALDDTATWRSVSYVPDGRGGSTRTYEDTAIPVWARNPGAIPSSFSKAPGETTYDWEFICPATALIQPKDVIQYKGNNVEVVEITQHGTSAFSQLVIGKQVSA